MDADKRADILSMDREQLNTYVLELGESRFRADQLYGWLIRGAPLEEMSNLPKSFREKVARTADIRTPEIRKKWVSAIDGTVKYLFELIDGELIESVVMRYEHGLTICVSSEAGCPMGCRFCASTIGGKVRDLTPSEILGQIVAAQRDTGERIAGVVLMGIGEPLDNYENVVRFLKLVSREDGLNIGLRHISLSTCGVVPRIYDLSKEDLPITLSVSLHAHDDETRSAIMPVNRKWNIDSLLTACRNWFDATGRRISFEYTLIAGKNDGAADAAALAALLKKYMERRPVHVNLIPVNPVSGRSFSRSSRESVDRFARILNEKGVAATVRRKLGSDIDASCGQLRHGTQPGAPVTPAAAEAGTEAHT